MPRDRKKNAESKESSSGLEKIKAEATTAFTQGEFDRAVKLFSAAIELDASVPALYTNRAASYLNVNEPQKALEDAQKSLSLNDKWLKGFLRRGQALEQLLDFQGAAASYADGLAIDAADAALLAAQRELNGVLEEMKSSHSESSAMANPEADKFNVMLEWLVGSLSLPPLPLTSHHRKMVVPSFHICTCSITRKIIEAFMLRQRSNRIRVRAERSSSSTQFYCSDS